MTFLFDVDGVICDRGEKIDPEFAAWLKVFLKDKKFHWVTGSVKERTIEQIGQELYDMCTLSYHCLGNQLVIDGEEVLINQFTLTEEENNFLLDCVTNSNFEYRTGNHIEMRKGSVNFSIPGKNADKEVRKLYIEYDSSTNERALLVQKIETTFPKFHAYIGGDISIDICLKNCNKSQVIHTAGPNNVFFGDRMCKFGIDVPLADITNSVHIKEGFRETWEILKSYDTNSS